MDGWMMGWMHIHHGAVRWDGPSGVYCGLFIEMKNPKGKFLKTGGLTAEQKDYIKFLTGQGYKCVICYSWTDARDEIINYYNM